MHTPTYRWDKRMNQYNFRIRITNGAWVSFASMIISVFLSVLSPIQALSQTAPNESLTIQRPESIDDATWQRLLSGFENEKQGFANLLHSLDSNRIDYTKDSMPEVILKQQAMRRLLDTFQMKTVRGMAQVDLILNYVFMRNQTSPRLTGRVINVGPQEKIKSLDEALTQAQSGDCIRLGKGVFEIGGNQNRMFLQPTDVATDIAIIGEGKDATKIKIGRRGEITAAVRWRISHASIDCGGSEGIDLRRGGSLEFLNCKIFNYDRGPGGTNAAMVVENTEMIGDTSRGSDAFHLSIGSRLYVRKVQFEENREVVSASFPCVFDRCTANGTNRNDNRISAHPYGTVLLRDSQFPIQRGYNVSEFKYAVDDLEFVDLALGNREKLDARSEQIVKTLQLNRHPAYWIGLLRHTDVEICKLAGERVETILPVKVKIAKSDAVIPNEEIDLAINQLGDSKYEVRNAAAKRLVQFGRLARKSLEAIAKTGSADQRKTAEQIIEQLSLEPNLAVDTECGRLLNWYEQNRAKLKWSESAGKYQLATEQEKGAE